MYNIKVEADFSSAHNLRGYKGKCEALHGHNWRVKIKITRDRLDKTGMLMDFKKVKAYLHNVIEKLDHKYLNDIPYFSAAGGSASGGKKHNPTSENIAKYIYDALKNKIPDLSAVTVWESDNCSATYYESHPSLKDRV